MERGSCELGFPSFERYAEERADVSPRTARRWVRLALAAVALHLEAGGQPDPSAAS